MSRIKAEAWGLIDLDGNVSPNHIYNTRTHARATLKWAKTKAKADLGLAAVRRVIITEGKTYNAWALVTEEGEVNPHYVFPTRAAARQALSKAKTRAAKTGNTNTQYAQLEAVKPVSIISR